MPLSDNYKYNVGDRVKNDLTKDEGRVLDIKAIGQGALLITVAIFVGGVAVSSKTFIQKVGQISGLEWSVASSAVGDGVSKLGVITNPLEGGMVSAAAQAQAAANIPSDRSISKLISDRLKAWNPKNVNPHDEEAFADALFDRIRHLQEVQRGVFKNKGRIDTLMNYLTATSKKGAQGQWYGNYLTELVRSPSSASANAIQDGDKIRTILQQTGIPVELSHRYKELIPEGVQTAWELLVHAKQKISGMSYTEGNPLWNDYASIISNAVELSPGRRRQRAAIDALNEAIDFTRETLGTIQGGMFSQGKDFSRFGIQGDRSEPETSFRTEHQFESIGFGKNRKTILSVAGMKEDPSRFVTFNQPTINPITGERYQGVIVPGRAPQIPGRTKVSFRPESEKFDPRHIKGTLASERGRGIDRFHKKRDELGPELSSILEGPETITTRDIGMRTGRARVWKLGFQAEDILQQGPTLPHLPGGNYVGKVVQYKGLPHQITAIDPVTRRATLTPFNADVDLRFGNLAAVPGSAVSAVRSIEERAATLPLAVDEVAKRAGQEAKRVSEQIAARKTIRIRGGLLGTTKNTVEVPLDLLREYMVGGSTFKDSAALTQAGFAGISDFGKKSSAFSSRFNRLLKQKLAAHPLVAGLGGGHATDRLEDLMQGAQISIFEHLGSIAGGRSIQQLEEELLNVAVANAARHGFTDRSSVVAQTFTELDRVSDTGEVLQTGLDRIDASIARSRARAIETNAPQFTTIKELRARVLGFEKAVGRLKGGEERKYAQFFREFFGHKTDNPLDVGMSIESLAEGIRTGEIDRPQAHAELTKLAETMGINVVPRYERPGTAPLATITPNNETAFVNLYQSALDLPPEQHLAAFKDLGLQQTLVGDRPAAVIQSAAGENFVVRNTERGLVAVSAQNPGKARFFGGAAQPFELGLEELNEAISTGKLKPSVRKISVTNKTAVSLAKKEAVLREFIGAPPSTLPVFKHGSNVVGFLENDLVNAQSVIENTKAAAAGRRALLFIDIETNREVNQITNFALRRLEKIDGVWTEVGEAAQIATPALWKMHGVGGSAASRIATREGATSLIGEVLKTEADLVERAAQLIAQHPDAIIAGHNIAFDVTKLAKAQGISQSAADILTGVARNRVMDTIFLAQFTHPNQPSLGLKELGKSLVGDFSEQAHLALPDVIRNIEVFKELAKRSDHALAGLNALQQVGLSPDAVLWTEQRGGRAYKLGGILDTEAASDVFYKKAVAAGLPYKERELGVGFGVALQPLDFRTKLLTGPFELNFAQTPHGWAKAFTGQFEILDPTTAAARMEAKAEDLARRRIRRITADESSFTNLLADRERALLGSAVAQGPEALTAAQNDILTRLGATTSPFEKGLLRQTFHYSQSYLQDSRIQRQLELEGGFLGEVATAHKPVVDWLEGALKAAPAGSLTTTKESVNRIWNEYMGAIHGASPFPEIPVVARPTVSLKVGALGENPVALWTNSAESLRSSLQRHTLRVAQNLQGTEELNNLLAGASKAEARKARLLIRHGRDFLDSELGADIERHIFEHHLGPALEEGLVQLSNETKTPLKVKAKSIDEAVSAILSRTDEVVRGNKETAYDYLAGRSLSDDVLASIQKKIGVGGDIVAAAEHISSPENLKIGLHLNAPRHWTGKLFTDIFETAINATAEEQGEFAGRMRGIYKKLAAADQEVVANLIKSKTPQLLDEITGVRKSPEIIQLAQPVRDFNPGKITTAGVELGEMAAENATALKAAGLIGLGIIAVGVGMMARKPHPTENQTREQDDEARYLHSTEGEISKRKDKVAQQQGVFNKITVSITGEDSAGVDHNELTESVHSALGTFLGREIHRASRVNDNRAKIDRAYLDKVAGQLLTRPTPVR